MLYDIIKDAKTLSIVGMCKNAGKTTVLNACLNALARAGVKRFAMTSIGSDGEDTDIVTGTKKPQIYVREGAVVATAKNALKESDITKEILFTTGIYTPLGEVIVCRAVSDGKVILAGPSTVDSLCRLRQLLDDYGIEKLIIDGALSRKTLSAPRLADGSILCSGASLSKSMDEVVRQTLHSVMLFSLPICEYFSDMPPSAAAKALLRGGEIIDFDSPSHPDVRLQDIQAIRLFGAVTDETAKRVIKLKDVSVIADDPTKIMLSAGVFSKLRRAGIRLLVENNTKLLLVALNPFSAYGFHFDSDEFFGSMCAALAPFNIPIFDFAQERSSFDSVK